MTWSLILKIKQILESVLTMEHGELEIDGVVEKEEGREQVREKEKDMTIDDLGT